MTVSTHVLDAALGRPAAGVGVALEVRGADGAWQPAGDGETDAGGRLSLPGEHVPGGPAPVVCRLTFATGAYFAARGSSSFYPEVTVTFAAPAGHCHVPLLLSPFAYSTYRGS